VLSLSKSVYWHYKYYVSNDSNINTVVGDLASVGENDVYLIEDTESLIKPEK
jgi:hypothetical protein